MSTLAPRTRAALAALAALAVGAAPLRAQLPATLPRVVIPVAGGEWERYARALQLTGATALRPWSLRPFGPAELAQLAPADTLHPWQGRPFPSRARLPLAVGLVAPDVRLHYNTAFPFGYNDGAVWAGRGATLAASAGAVVALGPLTVTLAPTYFAAQNSAFALMPNGSAGAGRFQSGVWTGAIDQPQRFGDDGYARLDWGQSSARVDAAGVSVGLSAANQIWGPAAEHPAVLGTNAAGFPHVFLGTARPLDIGIGRAHGRLIWGRLSQSDYSPADGDSRRFASGLVATFSPRGLPGFEIGGSRFFHTRWPAGGIGSDELWKPFEGILKQDLGTPDNPSGDDPGDNQLASVFARWAIPSVGIEVYGEYGREDHNQDGRDLALQPDQHAAYLLGVQRAWKAPGRVVVGRAEVLNARVTHLLQVRAQAPFYVHGSLRQGHTHLGQVLGSAGAFGGGASAIAADVYHRGGRWSVSWSRIMRAEYRRLDQGSLPDPDRADVQHVLGADVLAFRGRYELTAGAFAVQNFNRDFRRDAFNLNASIGARAHW